jgi:hypothetical protein
VAEEVEEVVVVAAEVEEAVAAVAAAGEDNLNAEGRSNRKCRVDIGSAHVINFGPLTLPMVVFSKIVKEQ